MDTTTDQYRGVSTSRFPPDLPTQSIPTWPVTMANHPPLSQQLHPVITVVVGSGPMPPPGGMEPIPEESEPPAGMDFASPHSSYSLRSSSTTAGDSGSSTTQRQSALLSEASLRSPPPPPDTSLASSILMTHSNDGCGDGEGGGGVDGGQKVLGHPELTTAHSTGKKGVAVEQRTQRLREVHTTEEIDTRVSTLPREAVSSSLAFDERLHLYSFPPSLPVEDQQSVVIVEEGAPDGDPNAQMTSHYHVPPGGSSHGTKYSYTYESHVDEPECSALDYAGYATVDEGGQRRQGQISPSDGQDIERHAQTSQKITRVTRVTTTRSVKQVPVKDPNDLFFDADGNPVLQTLPNGDDGLPGRYVMDNGGMDERTLGIDLSRTYISEREERLISPMETDSSFPGTAYSPAPPYPIHRQQQQQYSSMPSAAALLPSEPGRPEIVDVTDEVVSLVWLRPERDGEAGEILGYRVEFRRSVAEPWEAAHDDLLGETECKITNLDPEEMFMFRVVAANPAGYGPPSQSTQPIRLAPATANRSTATMDGGAGGFFLEGMDYAKSAMGSSALPPTPHRPIVSRVLPDGAAVVEWLPTTRSSDSSQPQITGYLVEYRPVGLESDGDDATGAMQWIPANDQLVPSVEFGPPRLVVHGLRPNGEYVFRILARNEEGAWSRPSASSAVVKMRPEAPTRGGNNGGSDSADYGMQLDTQLPAPGAPKEVGEDARKPPSFDNKYQPVTDHLHLQWTPADVSLINNIPFSQPSEPTDTISQGGGRGGSEGQPGPRHEQSPTTVTVGYLLEVRQLGTQQWRPLPIHDGAREGQGHPTALTSLTAKHQENIPSTEQPSALPLLLLTEPHCIVTKKDLAEVSDPTGNDGPSDGYGYYEYRCFTVIVVVEEEEESLSSTKRNGRQQKAAKRSPASEPSEPLSLVHGGGGTGTGTKPRTRHSLPPSPPSAPEFAEALAGSDQVTLCWLPARSEERVVGYEVEFRDVMQDPTSWYKLTDQLVRGCKTTVGYLLHGHKYQFRLLARNAFGPSEPSPPSPFITIDLAAGGAKPESASPLGAMTDGSSAEVKYVEAERHGTVALLQDEMIRESPPLPDRDDSPPPIYRQPGGANLQWRDPTLKEVIDYLQQANEALVVDASGYLQHLTYNNDLIKEECRQYAAVPALVRLLDTSANPEILRNAAGCLKNLSFGRANDANKRAINEAGGVRVLGRVIRRASTLSPAILEEASGALWNISSCDELKEGVLKQVADLIATYVVVPWSGLMAQQSGAQAAAVATNQAPSSNIFRNGTGILRNISAASAHARKQLRSLPNLVDALLHFLNEAVQLGQLDTRSVENTMCLLRNLSYRVQEVVDPKYDPNGRNARQQYQLFSGGATIDRHGELRSRSVPPGNGADSPKQRTTPGSKFFSSSVAKRRRTKDGSIRLPSMPTAKGNQTAPPPSGPTRLWHWDTVRLYLRVMQESAEPEILEAAAAALQNLAACPFDGSAQVRLAVRQEKGLPILVELLRLKDDRVVSAVAQALRNLVLDRRNLELVGKYAMKELVAKLPSCSPATMVAINSAQLKAQRGQAQQLSQPSDATLGAVLGILWEAVSYSAELARLLHETLDGTERLRTLAKSYPRYGRRICKYASQVLYMMWQWKELHDTFKRAGLGEVDFYSTGTIQKGGVKANGKGRHPQYEGVNTLARPISSQGNERTERIGVNDSMVATDSPQPGLDNPQNGHSGEPVYASVQKQQGHQRPLRPTNGYKQQPHHGGSQHSVGGDSWV